MISIVPSIPDVSQFGAASFVLVVICTLLLLLVQKEMLLANRQDWAIRLSYALGIAIPPLLFVSIITIGMRIVSIFR
jgi:hypothetical protein